MVHYALLSMLHLNNSEAREQRLSMDATTELRQRVSVVLEECEDPCFGSPGTLGFLKDYIEKAKLLLNSGTFYSFVTTKEKQQAYESTASQFSGTGHWYYCRSNHPVKLLYSSLNFNHGNIAITLTNHYNQNLQWENVECRMEAARCPQNGEPVGGINHASLPGVRRAEDMEEEFALDAMGPISLLDYC